VTTHFWLLQECDISCAFVVLLREEAERPCLQKESYCLALTKGINITFCFIFEHKLIFKMGGKGSKLKKEQEAAAAAAKAAPPVVVVDAEKMPVNDEILVIGDFVNTPYGTGVVASIRATDGMVIVRPDTWKLDRDHVPFFYLNKSTVHKSAVTLHSFNVGDYVNTPYGTGHVTETRADGMVTVRPDLWKVAGDHKPFFYMNASGVTRATNAGIANKIAVGDYVDSMYGTGYVQAIRAEDNMLIVRPDTWQLALELIPTFFLWAPAVHKAVVSHVVAVGDLVNTPYGVGFCTEIRASDGMLIVRPDTWEVAGDHKPFFYMLPGQVSKACNSHGNRYMH
jgi:hypothetical protein